MARRPDVADDDLPDDEEAASNTNGARLQRARSRTFPASDLQRPAAIIWSTAQGGLRPQLPQHFIIDTKMAPGDGLLFDHPKLYAGNHRVRLDSGVPSAGGKIISARSMLLTGEYGLHRWGGHSKLETRANGHPLGTPPLVFLDPPQGLPRHVDGHLGGSPSALLPGRAPGASSGSGGLPDQGTGDSKLSTEEDDDTIFLGDEDPNSMRSSLQLAVTIGQVFSLMPITADPVQPPRFQLLSPRMVYWLVVVVGLAFNALLAFLDQAQSGDDDVHSITGSSRWIFYVSATTISVLYFRLAQRWRTLCRCFLRVETGCRRLTSGSVALPLPLPAEWRSSPPGLRLRLRITTILTLSLALAEYSLSQLSSVMQMDLEKYSWSNLNDFFRDRFMGNYPHMLLVGPYSPLTLLITQLLNTTATFLWNYNDLFVMLISIIIARRFRQLNQKLSSDINEERSEKYWKSAREAYNALSYLTRDVDDLLGSQILFSFMNNLYFICIQLLHTVKHENNTLLLNIYFVYSFGFLLARTVAVSLTAASINDESKSVKKVLYSVPSDSYCDEVDRFLNQVTTDEVALTGYKFFSVTRSFLLTMAGTIATYEIVMVQFSGNSKTP